ncbi:hypothetical protein X975_11640, partial [Stegodyphus mimosarum]
IQSGIKKFQRSCKNKHLELSINQFLDAK